MVGLGVTVNELVVWAVQVPLAPITETLVDDAGLKVNVLPVTLPGLQVYDVAPLTVNVATWPAQIVEGLVASVGFGVTLTVAVVVLVQAPFDPVTV